MDPAELWAGLHEIFDTWITEEGENKLNALLLALQGDIFYRDVEVFHSVAQALLDGDLGDLINGKFDDLSAVEIMWAVLEVELARDDDQGPPEFSYGVTELINRVMLIEPEGHEEDTTFVRQEYFRMLDQLRDIGIPNAALRALDEEYAATMDIFDEPGEISVDAAS
jgi:hypothetical protein